MEPILDKIGQPVTPGCYIVYGTVLGRSAGLRIGKVLKAERRPPKYEWHKEEYCITVQGVYGEWVGYPPKLQGIGRLLFPSRMIVLPAEVIPAAWRELLESIEI